MQIGDILQGRQRELAPIQVRNQREDIVAQIMELTNLDPQKKKEIAGKLMLQANMQRWSNMDLHAVLSKKSDPKIYNYTGYICWLAYNFPKKVR